MMRWNNGYRNADGWKKIREKLEDTKWLVCIVFAMVAVSRLLVYLNFLIWGGRNSFDGGFFDALSIYDTAWYKSIIGDGYWTEPRWGDQGDSANWAFFPFYPLLMKGIHVILPFDYDLLAFAVNSVFFAFALVLAVKYILLTREDWVHALVFVFLMAFGVYNFYFSLLYTEAPFLFFVAAFFYCMERKQYLWMGIAGALASGTRNLGIMLVFPLAAHYLTGYFGSNRFRLKTFFGNFFGNVRLVLGTVLIPFGFFSYMLHLYFRVGDSMAFVHIERAWGKGDLTNPFRVLWNSLVNVDSFVFYLSLWGVWGIYCAWLLLCSKRWAEFVMAFLVVMIPLAASVIGVPRYLIGCFVPLFGFTDGMGRWRKSQIFALCVFSFVLGEICLWGWFDSAAFVM